MFLTPSMRLCGMDPWTVEVASSHFNNLPWRYDTLNKLILLTDKTITSHYGYFAEEWISLRWPGDVGDSTVKT